MTLNADKRLQIFFITNIMYESEDFLSALSKIEFSFRNEIKNNTRIFLQGSVQIVVERTTELKFSVTN